MIELNRIYKEPCLETIERFEDNSIDSVVTSPPYWQLRDYGYPEQWGLEPTWEEYLEHLWSLMDRIYVKLKPKGTCWINLGDTYNGNKQGNTDSKVNDAVNKSRIKKVKSSAPNKSLLLLPHRFAIGCMDRGWIVRNDIIWAKRNAMPESVTDRFSKKHEYFFLMTKSDRYYFDLDAIRDKLMNPVLVRNKASEIYGRGSGSKQFSEGERIWGDEEKGKNPGSVCDFWDITTKPSNDGHYATYNDELIKKPILSGCPKGGLIYDPFMGVGNTAIMALRTGRTYVGSEMGEDSCVKAEKKLLPFKIQTSLAI